jgi:hypothetical protein
MSDVAAHMADMRKKPEDPTMAGHCPTSQLGTHTFVVWHGAERCARCCYIKGKLE